MKKLYFVLLFFLTGCVTRISEPTDSIERIYAFMIEKDKIYLIGEQSDYLLQNQDVSAMQAFLTSSFAKQTLFFTMKLDSLDSDVKGEYVVYLDESKYNKEEKEKLQKQYWFNPISYIHSDLIPAVRAKNATWQANQPALKRQYRAFGQRLRFKNREEILNKYRLAQPINITLTSRTSSKQVIADDIASDIAVNGIFIPVYITYATVFTVVGTPIIITTAVIHIMEKNKQNK